MSNQITITLTEKEAKEIELLDHKAQMAMNKLAFFSEMFGDWPDEWANLSGYACLGLGAMLDEISMDICQKEKALGPILKQFPKN